MTTPTKTFTLRMGLHSVRNRIWITFPYDSKVVEVIKEAVQGIKWAPEEQLWDAPLDMDVARDIRAVAKRFNATLRVEPELAVWAKTENAKLTNLLRPDDVMQSDDKTLLPRLQSHYPTIYSAMQSKPWQIPGTAFIVAQRKILLADEPGLGKTLQAIGAVMELNITGAILVVAPKTAVAVTWPEEIAQWLGPNEHVVIINASIKPEQRKLRLEAAKRLAEYSERVWVITGPNYLRIRAELDDYGNYKRDEKRHKIIRVVQEGVADFFRMSFSAVIVDESSGTLAGNTGNKKRWSAQRLGLGALSVTPGGLRIAISGTPLRGKTENLWGTLNWLDSEKYTSYWKWIKRHYGVVDDFSSGERHMVKGDDIIDRKRFFSELRPIMVRRTYFELIKSGRLKAGQKFYAGTRLDPLNPQSPVAVWLPMDLKQAKQYQQVVSDALISLSGLIDNAPDEVVVNGSLAEMIRLKQLANAALGPGTGNREVAPCMPSNKIDWILNFLSERISNGTKTIVASQFTQFIDLLSSECTKNKIKHYVFTGKTNDRDRARIKTEFQSATGEMVILLNTASGGVSLTLDAADDVVVADQTWIPDDQEQVENRAYRISRNHNVTVWNLASLGTIDEDIALLNNERADAITDILDQQRGVTYVKQLVAMTRQRTGKAL